MNLFRNQIYRGSIILVMITSFIPVSLISKTAECAMTDSEMILPNGNKISAREIDAEQVRRTLENKIVAERLRNYGLSKQEIISKMDKMSDGQIHQLASLSNKITAGGYYATPYYYYQLYIIFLFTLLLIAIVIAVAVV